MSWPPLAAERRVVVSDAGPLIALGRLDLLALLPALFADIQVPRQVFEECQVRPERIDAQRIRQAMDTGQLLLCDVEPIASSLLDLGERAAIARALSIRAGLLADDRAARQYAQSLGLLVVGTLGVLVLAKRGGLIPEIRPAISSLQSSGQRLSRVAVSAALAAAGESD